MPVLPIERKLEYIEFLASEEGIDLSMLKWGFILPKIFLNSSWNIYLKLLLDLDLVLNFHFDIPDLQFPIPELTPDLPKIEKARYGISKYNESIYDPQQVTSFHLENAIWDLRYKATEHCALAYKHTSTTLKTYFDSTRDILIEKGVRDFYVNGILDAWAVIEGKALTTSYVGFSVVGITCVGAKSSSAPLFTLRLPIDWKTEVKFETYSVYESHVGTAIVGYARVISKEYGISQLYLRELSKNLVDTINRFHSHTGKLFITVPTPKIPTHSSHSLINSHTNPELFTFQFNFERLFLLQRVDRLHWKGGEHQLHLQMIINKVKKVLDREGIISQMRMGYISFAEELAYLYHGEDTRWKEWKKCLTKEDLIDKYVAYGLRKDILNRIALLV